jgi:hypothetical protein
MIIVSASRHPRRHNKRFMRHHIAEVTVHELITRLLHTGLKNSFFANLKNAGGCDFKWKY